MTAAERTVTWRRWKAYVRQFPARYRIRHCFQGTEMIAVLEEYEHGTTFRQNPFFGVVLRYYGMAYDWNIVEEMPRVSAQREDARA